MCSLPVFVYGTLKRCKPNHHLLTDRTKGSALFVGAATTQEKYPLVVASRYNIPYLLAAPGEGQNVKGEVYEVDEKMQESLDQLEDHPDYYERKVKKVILDSGKVTDCWIYLLHDFKPHMKKLPFLNSYGSEDDPNKQYIPKYLREAPGSEYWTDVKNIDS